MGPKDERLSEIQDWKGKVALITGATSGIGLGIAQAFAEAGMRVALGYRRIETVSDAIAKLGIDRALILPVEMDVRFPESVSDAVAEVVETFGALNVLVNNAGIQNPSAIASLGIDEWREMMATNVDGVFYGVRAALPHILGTGELGHVLTTGSILGLFTGGDGRYGAYCTSKFAVTGMMEALRWDLESTSAGVSLLCPGRVRSNLEAHLKDAPAALDPLEIGRVALRGMCRNDLYILSHPEFIPVVRARADLIASSATEDIAAGSARLSFAREALEYSGYERERKRMIASTIPSHFSVK